MRESTNSYCSLLDSEIGVPRSTVRLVVDQSLGESVYTLMAYLGGYSGKEDSTERLSYNIGAPDLPRDKGF